MIHPVTSALAGALLLGSACIAPRPAGQHGSSEELARLMGEAGARPVQGTEEEGLNGALEESGEVDPEAAEEALAAVEPEPVYEESPYIRFGEQIIVREVEGTTFVTKPYTLPLGRPEKIVQLMKALDPFPERERPPEPDAPLDPGVVEHQILASFDTEYYTDFTKMDAIAAAPQQVPLSDVLVVTAVPDMLASFEEFLDLFAGGGVPQIELEAKIIEIVETDSLDYGGSGSFLFGGNNFVKALDVNLPNFSNGTEALLTIGAIQDQVAFDAILEAVKSWQNVSIESQPKTVVRSGGVARIDTSVDIPYLQFKTLNADGTFVTTTEYKKIGAQLWISPRRVGSSTLALDVRLEGSQRVGSQAIISIGSSNLPVDIPVVAYRTAKTVVHLKPGQTLVIGGLTQEREQEIVNKIPILGDIPLLGFFFSSKFRTMERQTVIFAISPRIIQRSDFESEI